MEGGPRTVLSELSVRGPEPCCLLRAGATPAPSSGQTSQAPLSPSEGLRHCLLQSGQSALGPLPALCGKAKRPLFLGQSAQDTDAAHKSRRQVQPSRARRGRPSQNQVPFGLMTRGPQRSEAWPLGGHTWGDPVWSLVTPPPAPPHPRRSQNSSVTSVAPPQGGAACNDADGRRSGQKGISPLDTCSVGAVTRQPGTPGPAGVRGQEQHKKLRRVETGEAAQGTEG